MNGQTTALTLPDGGILEVPLPGSKGRFSMRAPSLLGDTGSRLPFIFAVAVGVAIGVTATAWYLRRR